MIDETVDHGRGSTPAPLLGDRARREQILDTAAGVFAHSGYAATVMKDLADACGILPGSLYHHFASKEALMVELLKRFRAEAADVGARAMARAYSEDHPSAPDQIVVLACAVADLSVRHRAATHYTRYEPPTNAGAEFTTLASDQPPEIGLAIEEILAQGRAAGDIAADIDLTVLADALYILMQGVGLGVLHENDDPRATAETLAYLVLGGIAGPDQLGAELDDSEAMAAARREIASWNEPNSESVGDKLRLIQSAARAEFARRGFEATTVRDIASAAGVGPGAIYRVIDSKHSLLLSIMSTYQASVSDAYDAVVDSVSTAVEKIDALAWVNVNVVETFRDEFKIQSAYLRVIAPASGNAEWAPHERRAKQLLGVVTDGVRAGQLQAGGMAPSPSNALLARCVRDLMWPAHVVHRFGKEVAMDLCRKSLIHGITRRV
ncbi:TetR/AcrR family transcriptional regulator [Rhodococcus qingshengii]|uniref:TetR/AcrR family transcriptional regulator n=1 Tax=Rhodococcus qingshengii TaxID=334542 RepID=UPI001BEBD342|nr:TetR/AcrR family transcriptional regulator [Rhodococcus qingshengii]MBT2275661.1 TetR/AcrR family transcriptional regulator [Rhodococcus qingshengii]